MFTPRNLHTLRTKKIKTRAIIIIIKIHTKYLIETYYNSMWTEIAEQIKLGTCLLLELRNSLYCVNALLLLKKNRILYFDIVECTPGIFVNTAKSSAQNKNNKLVMIIIS